VFSAMAVRWLLLLPASDAARAGEPRRWDVDAVAVMRGLRIVLDSISSKVSVLLSRRHFIGVSGLAV
jgi:hypothetical protein